MPGVVWLSSVCLSVCLRAWPGVVWLSSGFLSGWLRAWAGVVWLSSGMRYNVICYNPLMCHLVGHIGELAVSTRYVEDV